MASPGDPTGRYPLPIRSVFISSRMEELAIERRAAFNAVYESFLIPLLFEIEPPENQLKAQLDNLDDRADLFVGLYYRSFGRPIAQLYEMTPIEYEFLRFLELWRIRYKYEDRWAAHGLEVGMTARSAREAERDCVDTALQALQDRTVRHRFLRRVLHAASLSDSEYHGSEENYGADMKYYRAIIRTRVGFFVRTDAEDFGVSRDLSQMIGVMGSFHVIPIRPRPMSPHGSPAAQRFAEPHVVLYEELKLRLREAVRAEVLAVRDGPERQEAAGFTMYVEVLDKAGLLETVLEVFFTKGLNISVLHLRRAVDDWVPVVIQASAFMNVDAVDHRSIRMDVELALCKQLAQVDVHEVAFDGPCGGVCSGNGHDPAPSRSKLSDRVLRRIRSEDECAVFLDAAELYFDERPDIGEIALDADDTFSIRIQGADVPGMFLSIARVVKECGGNIVRVAFGPASTREARASGVFLTFHYFSGDICVQPLQGFAGRGESGERDEQVTGWLLDLRYKLLNLLGVQAVRIMPASDLRIELDKQKKRRAEERTRAAVQSSLDALRKLAGRPEVANTVGDSAAGP